MANHQGVQPGDSSAFSAGDAQGDEGERAQEALRESEERYRALFEQAADSIVLIDAETGALVQFNDRAHEALGYTREEFEKLQIPDFEVVESAEEVANHIRKIIKDGADTFETKHRRNDGEIRDVQVHSRALSIRGRDFVQSIWRDITERKQMEQALEEALEKAREGIEDRVERRLRRRNVYGLTFRELTVLRMMAAGQSDRDIGISLGTSRLTAQKHVSNILRKMHSASRTDAAVRALREGLID